jgi:hypothetical protein
MDVKPHDEHLQRLYARWLDAATKTGFAASLCAFLLYVSGALPPYVPPERLPELWGLPVGRFLEQTGAPTGWSWVALMDHGDYLSLAAVALFGLITPVCYLRIVAPLLRHGERLQAALVSAQIAVLAAAISGLFAGG